MENEQTKTVAGTFGDKQITRAEFVLQWTAQVNQFWFIATDGRDAESIDNMLAAVKDMAARKWDSIK